MERAARIVILGYALLSLVGFGAYAHASSVASSSVSGYAWGDNLGWINFGCTKCTVRVSDTAVTGYAWSSQEGWINFSPAHAGVVNDGNGMLSGYAWSTGLGWINFSGALISNSGSFSGVVGVASSSVGRITFDCSRCNVTTDWRPVVTQVQAISGGGGGGMAGYYGLTTVQMGNAASGSGIQPISSPALPLNAFAAGKPIVIMPTRNQRSAQNNKAATAPRSGIASSSASIPSSSVHGHTSFFAMLTPYFLLAVGVILLFCFIILRR